MTLFESLPAFIQLPLVAALIVFAIFCLIMAVRSILHFLGPHS